MALAMAVTGGASAACSGGSDRLSTVVSIAPQCFTLCPNLCKPLDKLLAELNTTSGKALKDTVCRETRELDCAFGVAFAECEQLVSMSSKLAPDWPTSAAQWTDFKQKCASSSGPRSSDMSGSREASEGQPEQLDSERATQDMVQMVATKAPNQRLRGETSSVAGLDADAMGIPLGCDEGCTWYVFGCGMFGNPPACGKFRPRGNNCCVKGR